jgi:GR25 family glycosyltransferase involved in LPS biosynthesis
VSDIPPIYCITLTEEPWKQAAAEKVFDESNLPVTFVHGFHGNLLGLRTTNPFAYTINGVPEYIHVAQLGAALSHIHALKVALLDYQPEFIICEDDVSFSPLFIELWARARKSLPDNIGVLQLEYSPVQISGTPVMSTILSPGVSRTPHFAMCAACIWWRREAAEEAVQRLRPIDAPYDIMLVHKVYPFLGHALCTPPLVTQRTSIKEWPSSIGDSAGKVLELCSTVN